MIAPLHLRVLLDEARLKIMRKCDSESWELFRGSRSITQLTDYVVEKVGLSQDLSAFVCEYNNIRHAGNKAAHVASADDVRDAVLQKDVESAERKLLERLYRFVYGKAV
jgi:hypothetical protein